MASTALAWCIVVIAGVAVWKLLSSARGSISLPGVSAKWGN